MCRLDRRLLVATTRCGDTSQRQITPSVLVSNTLGHTTRRSDVSLVAAYWIIFVKSTKSLSLQQNFVAATSRKSKSKTNRKSTEKVLVFPFYYLSLDIHQALSQQRVVDFFNSDLSNKRIARRMHFFLEEMRTSWNFSKITPYLAVPTSRSEGGIPIPSPPPPLRTACTQSSTKAGTCGEYKSGYMRVHARKTGSLSRETSFHTILNSHLKFLFASIICIYWACFC